MFSHRNRFKTINKIRNKELSLLYKSLSPFLLEKKRVGTIKIYIRKHERFLQIQINFFIKNK